MKREIFIERSSDPFVAGYIIGYSSGRLASYGIEDNDQKLSALNKVCNNICEGDEGGLVLYDSIALHQSKNHPDFQLGFKFGWDQMEDFFLNKNYPDGLQRYLLTGKIPK